jgi:hypothetical protein
VDALTRHRLSLLGLEAADLEPFDAETRARRVYEAFVHRIPYETLSAMERRRSIPADPEAWPRTTDRLLREARSDGTGGTCFSLSYALAELFRGVGANAAVTLGQHLSHRAPHAAVVLFGDEGPVLYDPSFLLPGGEPVRPGGSLDDGLFRHVLEPRRGPMLALVRTGPDATPKPLFAWIPMPAPPDSFLRAWIESFSTPRAGRVRMARRRGDEIVSYAEEHDRLYVLTPAGRCEDAVGQDCVAALHRHFGLSEALLRAHFAAGTRR